MKVLNLIIVTLFYIQFSIFSQNDLKLYNQGLSAFNKGNYILAEKKISEAILINPGNKDFYYDRGIARYNMGDSCGFCEDMKMASEFGDSESNNLMKAHCLKCDSISMVSYKKALLAINAENWNLADSLLTISINNKAYLDNQFSRGIIKFALYDTCGFCSDMRVV